MKKRIVVIFGGRSSEHEVSCVSGRTVAESLDPEKYDVELVGITKGGNWLCVDSTESMKDGSWVNSKVRAVLSPDTGDHHLAKVSENGTELVHVDVAFPVLHGLYGEDGTIQGLFEMARLPYVGCGVIASAVSMDKWFTKMVVNDLSIRQAKAVGVKREIFREDENAELDRVEKELNYPVFVKPSNAGSSCGVSCAGDREQLRKGIRMACEHDRKILIEERIIGRELECAVMGGWHPGQGYRAAGVGEILAAADFYDYDAKYNNAESKTVVNPDLPEGKREEIMEDAIKIFREVDGYGLARVDFFMEKDTNEIIFNEINTLPGFTPISMYPMLFEAAGLTKRQQMDELIALAEKRFDR